MRFALLGDHRDGIKMADALVKSGRHQVIALLARSPSGKKVTRFSPPAKVVGDVEEILADPAVEAVIVAGRIADRPGMLRRALQSERHVLCVHPADLSPDAGYEAALLQEDTGRVLLPILPARFHPGVVRLADILRSWGGSRQGFLLLELSRQYKKGLRVEPGAADSLFTVPEWTVLRTLGGEIAEVSVLSAHENFSPDDALVIAGRFERGGLFQVALVPHARHPRWEMNVRGAHAEWAELRYDMAFDDCPASLNWVDVNGAWSEVQCTDWDEWQKMVAAFEAAVGPELPNGKSPLSLDWQDAIRALELDDAARRSLARRRATAMEYPEASEEVGFKGTMTLVGCGMLWGILFLFIVAIWLPQAQWAIIPLLVVFLALQLLRWVIPRRKKAEG